MIAKERRREKLFLALRISKKKTGEPAGSDRSLHQMALFLSGSCMTTQLCPAQQKAYDHLLGVLPLFSVVGLSGGIGAGKTTVLRELRQHTGGEWLSIREFVHALRTRHPLALEETFEQLVEAAFQKADRVLVDDLSLLVNVAQSGCGAYPRTGLLSAALECITSLAEAGNKKLIFTCAYALHELHKKGLVTHVSPFEPADYEFFCRVFLGAELAERLDYRKIYRFARNLNAYDLRTVSLLLKSEQELTTDRYIDTLRTFGLTSNVNLGEVQQVTLADLKGVDHVIQSLEANVILPLEQVELADELRLKPKRGVLLAGPPGTGKTTVGRALAHRLKSKFFLIDGTCISGTHGFYGRIHQIFEEAKHNAPAIIFVDDSDVIFESGEELGLYRYLLTMLDGLESASVGQVCVMMTAMDVGHIPPALIRSGRIELWLEMSLPDGAARAEILQSLFRGQAAAFGEVDRERLVGATEGFTGADLKRLVEDGKNLFAYDRVRQEPLRPTTEYFLRAVEAVRENKTRYAEAEARARTQRPSRPVYFDQSGMDAPPG
jgi:transitional endoplasmic reticulum ATPase